MSRLCPPRLLPMVSWALLLFCAAPASGFGQTAASPPPPAANVLAVPPVSGVAASVNDLQPNLDALDATLETVKSELDKADRRTRQSRQYGSYLLALNGVVVLLVVLVLTGAIGRFPLISRRDWATAQKLRAVRKRQAKLKAVTAELKLYMVQCIENRDEVSTALATASKGLIRTEAPV